MEDLKSLKNEYRIYLKNLGALKDSYISTLCSLVYYLNKPEIENILQFKYWDMFKDDEKFELAVQFLKSKYPSSHTHTNYVQSIKYFRDFLNQKNNMQEQFSKKGDTNIKPQPLNQILYGPPGTGKTFNTIIKAMEICKKNIIKPTLNDYKTWYREKHPSIKESTINKDYINTLKRYNKEVCNIFDVTNDIEYREYKNKIIQSERYQKGEINSKNSNSNNHINTITNSYMDFYNDWINTKTKSNKDTEYKILKQNFNNQLGKQIEFITFHQSYSYEEFVEGIKPIENSKNLEFNRQDGILKIICDRATENPDKNYVLIIDEINRGNISKIFGELITLIEEDKRENMTVTLSYSKDPFTVPKNLYIIGTMNTADKSLALLDVALRRRFEFVPMYPKYADEVPYIHEEYSKILKAINDEILIKKKNADYLIGHYYFMGDESLENIFNHKVIPLLMEYFNNKADDVYALLTSTRVKKVCQLKFEDKYTYPEDSSNLNGKYYYLQVVSADYKEDEDEK